ncbi:hypothetical protein ABVT39_019134 [Epinephelus coioides]
MAAVGEDALLNCQLMQPKDVVQVTWQKVLPDKEQNVATYTKYFGEKVNRDFRDKVEFKYAGLQNSSIVIRRVKEEDEGCYHCLFNTYPDGALTGSTCLQLYELHEPVLHVRESNSPEEAVVSCSATGRPAPTVTLTVPHYNSTSVTNTNTTVTVTATAVLPRLHGNSAQVGCAVRVLSGPQIEVFTMIPEVTLSSADGEKHLGVNVTLITVLVVVSCVCVAAAVIIILLIRKHQNSVTNTNAMVTVTATAVLPRLHGNSTQSGCAVRVLSGPQIEVFTMIPEVTLSSADDVTLITVLVVVSCVCVAAAVIIILFKRKYWNGVSHRDSEENKTPQRTTKDTEE